MRTDTGELPACIASTILCPGALLISGQAVTGTSHEV